MANIKAGQVALLKATEEPVFILQVLEKGKTFPELSGSVAIVRRPTQGQNGVFHSLEEFYVEELESLDDKRTRQVSEMEELKARFKTNEAPSAQGELFSTN